MWIRFVVINLAHWWKSYYIRQMATKKYQKKKWESVKMNAYIVGKVRELKTTTGIGLSAFFEIAANEKMARENKK